MRDKKRCRNDLDLYDYRGVERHLADMAAKLPRTLDEFLDVSGVGAVKAQRYGEEFLAVIAAWEAAK